MKKLIICEKREAADYLAQSKSLGSNFKRGAGFIQNDKYIITWCVGHLYRQEMPGEVNEDYSLKYKLQNNFDYKIPSLKNEIKYIPDLSPKYKGDTMFEIKKRQLNSIKTLLKNGDYDEIILAADADAEGERIHSDPIKYNKSLVAKGTKFTRFWNTGSYKSIKAVDKAMKDRKLMSDDKYKNLLQSANARSMSDYLVGMKLTKVLSDKTNSLFRCGRVLSVLIGMIGRRENEVNNFVPKDYWNIKGVIGDKNDDSSIKLNHYFDDVGIDKKGNEIKVRGTRYFNEDEVKSIMSKIKSVNLTGVVDSNPKTKTSSRKPKLYSTDEFNTDFMGRFNVTLAYSNATLEWLRNNEYTTYPRTDGNYFDPNDFSEFESTIKACELYYNDKVNSIKQNDNNFNVEKLTTNNGVFDAEKAAKQNHTPIVVLKALSQSEKNELKSPQEHNKLKITHLLEAYEMIATRCLIQVLPDDIINKEDLTIDIAGYKFEAHAEVVEYKGWKQFDENATIKKNTKLGKSYKDGETIKLDDLFSVAGKTTKPLLYTEKSLLHSMMFVNEALNEEFNNIQNPEEKQKRMLNFKNVKKILTSAKGIGTQATRENIFAKLKKDDVIETKGGKIVLTENGKYQYSVLPSYLKSLETTAIWEQKLDDIRTGSFTYEEFIDMVDNSIFGMVDSIVQSDKITTNKFAKSNSSTGKATPKQIELVKKIGSILQIDVPKDAIKNFSDASTFIQENGDKAFNSGNRTLSDSQVKFIMHPKSEATEELIEIAKKRTVSSEEYKTVSDFISEKIKNIDTNKKDGYTISEKQLNLLNDSRNSDKVGDDIKELINNKKEFSKKEFDLIKKTIDNIFKSFSKK